MARSTGKPRQAPSSPRSYTWDGKAAYHFTSKDGVVKSKIEEQVEGDVHLVIDCGNFETLKDARNIAHMVLWFLLDKHGCARDYDDFPYHIFESAAAPPAVVDDQADVEVVDDLDDYEEIPGGTLEEEPVEAEVERDDSYDED